MVEIALLLSASVLMWWRPAGLAVWVSPVIGAAVALLAGLISVGDAVSAIGDIVPPLLFLVFAVPLAVALDDVGVFAALAASVDGGRHLVAWLWALAAAVVIVFNLDAAVVLLTPLYIRLARRHGLDVEVLAFQPALLACLASGVLPVSNLTNLIVAERFDFGVIDFVTNLAAPSIVAVGVGFLAYRTVFHLHPQQDRVDEPVDSRALRRGLPIVGFVLAGFTLGDVLSIPAWVVALAALVWATALNRKLRWRSVPTAAVALTAGLVVLTAAATPHLGLSRWFAGSSWLDELRAVGVATAMSNIANNLPTVLAASSAIEHPSGAWPMLIGANIGAVFAATASLSTLLWRDTAGHYGVHVTPRRWSGIAARVGIPSIATATLVQLVLPT